MGEVAEVVIAVGEKVRVHFHPPGRMKSFCEGVVSRVDVTTPEGRFFTVGVMHEVILDHVHRIGPGFEDYVRYECRNDFPGRIEILSTVAQDVETEPAPVQTLAQSPEEAEQEAEQEANEPHRVELKVHSTSQIVQTPETATDFEPNQVDGEPQPVRKPSGLMAALFGRKR